MFNSIVRFFWPDIKDAEIKKFGILAATLFCSIGSYWLLRLLKDTVFMKIAFPVQLGWEQEQGALFQPLAKTLSPLVIIFCVIIYSKLVDIFEKHKLFYVICSFYVVLFGIISTLLAIRDVSGDEALGRTLMAAVGWISYFSIESFGSITIPMFWSFVISITDSESAKTGFPFILVGAQLGSISGSFLSIFSKEIGGVSVLFFIGTGIVCIVMGLIYVFMRVIPEEQLQGENSAKINVKKDQLKPKKEGFVAGFYNGLSIIFKNPYLMGVFIVSTAYEVVGTIIDYQMKRQASLSTQFAGEAGFAKFMGIFGMSANGLSFLLALLGTSYIMKRFGLRICLFVFPVVLGISVVFLYLYSQFGGANAGQLLWATFVVMIVCKGLTYSLNNPTKDMMYIPTSKEARYKAKGWIEMFGARTAKMGGSQVTNAFKQDVQTLLIFGTVFSLGIIAFWLFAAWYVGKKNHELINEGKIISPKGTVLASELAG